MQTQTRPFLTAQDYLAWERQQPTRNEYINGEVFAMTGASRAHNLLCGNAFAALHGRLRGTPCEVYTNDMRVRIDATGSYVYPDIVAACGEPRFEDAQVDTLLNPVLVIEVLSPSTADYDRGAKFAHYRRLPSLLDFLLIAQDDVAVEHYARQPDGAWLLREYRALGAEIDLRSVGCRLLLAEVYERLPPPVAD